MNKAGHFLRQILNESELRELNTHNSIVSTLERQAALREFFHRPDIFEKVQVVEDPAWISFDIFINGKHYDF